MKRCVSIGLGPCLLIFFLTGGTRLAGQSVYEGFADYVSAADIFATNGGTGYAGAWQSRNGLLGSGPSLPGNAVIEVRSSSLAYADGQGNRLVTSGGSLFLSGANGNVQIARTLDVSAFPHQGPNPQTGATTYLSFLAQRTGPAANPSDPIYGGSYPWGTNLYPRAAGVNLFSNDAGDAVQLFIGGVSNATEDVWRMRGQDLDGVSKDPRIDQPFGAGNLVYLVVMRIDHGQGDGGADELNLYLNPILSSEGANVIGVTADWETRDDPLYLPGDWMGLEVGDASGNRPFSELAFDEFRLGDSWASVLPFVAVPEPAALALAVGMLGLGVVLRRRRRGAPGAGGGA